MLPVPEDYLGEGVFLVTNGIPDWVRVPDGFPLYAGEQRRVMDVGFHECVLPDCDQKCVFLMLDGEGSLRVCCCNEHGFVTYSLCE